VQVFPPFVDKWSLNVSVDIDVNVLDATGDRILAGEELKKENVSPLPTCLFLACEWGINDRRN